jgi:Zn-dependent peptidase ImmA (M78 family)
LPGPVITIGDNHHNPLVFNRLTQRLKIIIDLNIKAMAFTLMHELAHLLLHKTSMLDNQADFYSYQGREQEANIFASNLLLPDELTIGDNHHDPLIFNRLTQRLKIIIDLNIKPLSNGVTCWL